jgi:hypothetical protein
VPAFAWTRNPISVVQGNDARHPQTPLGPPVMWAAWAVDALHYLDDLDQAESTYPAPVRGHNADVVDIAHVRWATGTAVTSLDLCAAALGRVYCGWTDTKELDLRAFQRGCAKGNRLYRIVRPVVPTRFRRRLKDLFPDRESREVENRRSLLPLSALAWVDNVIADARYKQIQGARNQFTHSWLSRRLFRGGAAGHSGRTHFAIRGGTATPNARTLVELAGDLATNHVVAFFAVIDSL